MELLWSAGLHINTVHVKDVARAMWELKDKAGETYNLVDHSHSSMCRVLQTSLVLVARFIRFWNYLAVRLRETSGYPHA